MTEAMTTSKCSLPAKQTDLSKSTNGQVSQHSTTSASTSTATLSASAAAVEAQVGPGLHTSRFYFKALKGIIIVLLLVLLLMTIGCLAPSVCPILQNFGECAGSDAKVTFYLTNLIIIVCLLVAMFAVLKQHYQLVGIFTIIFIVIVIQTLFQKQFYYVALRAIAGLFMLVYLYLLFKEQQEQLRQQQESSDAEGSSGGGSSTLANCKQQV